MKCLVCGLSYINVGVHAKHKHGLTADEYRFEFGLKMSTPLVDNELSERLSKSMIARLKDDAYLKEQQHKCKENASKNIGRKWKNDLTHDARTALVESHKRRNDAYLESKRKEVEAIYQEKRTLIDIRKQIGMSPIAAKKILGNVAPDKNEWLSRVANSVTKRRSPKIEELRLLLQAGNSLAASARLAQVPYTTAKKWRKGKLL